MWSLFDSASLPTVILSPSFSHCWKQDVFYFGLWYYNEKNLCLKETPQQLCKQRTTSVTRLALKHKVSSSSLFCCSERHWEALSQKSSPVFISFRSSSAEITRIWSAAFQLPFQQSYALRRSFQLKSIAVYL